MTDQFPGAAGGVGDADPTGPVIRDRRKLDPETGQVREEFTHPHDDADVAAFGEVLIGTEPFEVDEAAVAGALDAAEAKAAERLGDLQRLQAEYVNYRKRVERDRFVAGDLAVAQVIEALIPTLDDIELARQHGELDGGPFAAIAEKLETALARFDWVRYGGVGEAFDPTVHEALMHGHSSEVTESTVTQVLQPGYKVGDRIVRAARVAVTDPE